jgi:hypothetical protein
MRVIYPLIIAVLSFIITLTALKYSIKYLSVATDYMLYKHVGGGTEYLVTDYKINPTNDCMVSLDVMDKYYQPFHRASNTNIRVCYRLTDMTIYWTSNVINDGLPEYLDVIERHDDLQITFEYEKGSLSGLKFK